jgi:hypothetical protein
VTPTFATTPGPFQALIVLRARRAQAHARRVSALANKQRERFADAAAECADLDASEAMMLRVWGCE